MPSVCHSHHQHVIVQRRLFRARKVVCAVVYGMHTTTRVHQRLNGIGERKRRRNDSHGKVPVELHGETETERVRNGYKFGEGEMDSNKSSLRIILT